MVRFGRTLELTKYGPWKDNYIDYSKLKKILREDESAPSSPTTESQSQKWTEDDESKFVDELVNVQLEKIFNFHSQVHNGLTERVTQCEANCDNIATSERQEQGDNGAASESVSSSNGKKAVLSDSIKKATLRDILSELEKITKELNELEKYARINYTGFLKAAKKHDRKRGHSYRVRPLLQVRLATLPFNKEDYGPLLFRLSTMYNFVRQRLDETGQVTKTADNQEGKDEYTSHKFWVHHDNLLEVKTMILRHLPVLVYNPQTSKVAEGNQPDPSITSIYFDSPAFDLYTHKVDHNAGSSLRLRWYGQLNTRPQIFVEKKTVGEDNRSRESRFVTKDKYIQRFINGEYQMEKQIQKLENRAGIDSQEAKALKAAVEDIQGFIREHDLQPVVRANYTRTAFQVPGEDRVRISLDTDLAFIREDALDLDRPCRDPENWHRTDIDNNELSFPFSAVRKGEINRFPFALLEIKLRNDSGKKNPEWIRDIMNSHLVKEAPRFSKFVHGTAELFEDYVNTFPFWLSQMETDIRRDPQQAFEEEQAKRQKQRDDEFAVGSLLPSTSHKSPSRKDKTAGVISPVGSPAVKGSSLQRGSEQTKSSSPLGPQGRSATAEPTQMNETAGELDDDETGTHTGHGTRTNGGFKSFFHSTSKYAQSRRSRLSLPPGVVEPKHWIKDQGPNKVEGKVWLANQRTFIKWQHVSILLASLSLGLFNAAGPQNTVGKVLGVVYTCVAVFAAAWGYGVYMWRSNLIQTRSGKDFDAVAGPVIVCLGLIVALILNFGFKYHAITQERTNRDSAAPAMVVQTAYL